MLSNFPLGRVWDLFKLLTLLERIFEIKIEMSGNYIYQKGNQYPCQTKG